MSTRNARTPDKAYEPFETPESGTWLRDDRDGATVPPRGAPQAPLATRIAEAAAREHATFVALEIKAIVKDMRARLADEVGPGGLIDTTLSLAPRLAPALQQLMAHRESLRGELDALEDCIYAPVPVALAQRYLRCLGAAWGVHMSLGDALLQDALLTDLGEAG